MKCRTSDTSDKWVVGLLQCKFSRNISEILFWLIPAALNKMENNIDQIIDIDDEIISELGNEEEGTKTTIYHYQFN